MKKKVHRLKPLFNVVFRAESPLENTLDTSPDKIMQIQFRSKKQKQPYQPSSTNEIKQNPFKIVRDGCQSFWKRLAAKASQQQQVRLTN